MLVALQEAGMNIGKLSPQLVVVKLTNSANELFPRFIRVPSIRH